jgi:hypothetical protein
LETSVAVQMTVNAEWRNGAAWIGGSGAHQPGLCASQRPLSAAAKSSATAALTASGSSLVMV